MADMYTFDAPEHIDGCVFRLYWGNAYVIVKCKTFLRAKTIIENSLHTYLVKSKPDLLYNRFFGYIKLHPGWKFRVEVVFKSNNPYQLLIHEQIELDKAKNDAFCFNQNFDAYVPKGIQGRRKSWVNRGHYLNFCIWKKKYHQQTHGT